MQINVNSNPVQVPPQWQDESLLNVLREHLGLVGTKYGCGAAQCGACTVHLDGEAIRSCVTPVSAVAGRAVTTIEGLSVGGALHRVQQAWLDCAVPQCGYCQAGQIMSAAALLKKVPRPGSAQVDEAMAGNLCRCGTQQRIRAAISKAAGVAS